MGGDNAPVEPVKGAIDASGPGTKVLLVGDEPQIRAEVERQAAVGHDHRMLLDRDELRGAGCRQADHRIAAHHLGRMQCTTRYLQTISGFQNDFPAVQGHTETAG